MATPSDITAGYRRQQAALRASTMRDMLKLWPALDWQNLERTYPVWFEAVSTLVARDRGSSSALSARYVRAFRQAHGLPGDVRVILAPAAPLAQVSTSMTVTGPVAFKKGIAVGMTTRDASANALVQAAGAASRLVLDAGRDTVRLTSIADPAAQGWVRVGNGGCNWCAQYLDGEVHRVEGYDFQAHDHCSCSAEPAYGA